MARMLGKFLLLIAITLPLQAEDRLPNIVLLVGDDHGYDYFGFMGDEHVVTPTMDAIAEGGFVFTQGHTATPYCRPSLRAIITGLHPAQYAHQKNAIVDRRRGEDDVASMGDTERAQWEAVAAADAMSEIHALPRRLQALGYASWEGGKWWERTFRNAGFTEGMTDGWDFSYWGKEGWFYQLWGAEGEDLVRKTMDPLFDFIDRHQDQPFLVWFGPALPHVPLDAPYQYTKFYEHKNLSNSAKAYYANITWWDDGVSRLMDHIQSRGLLEDTLFIYMTDNGWDQEPNDEFQAEPGGIYNDNPYASGGFKGKGALYDTSFRSPLIFYWNGRISGSFNTTSLVTAMDIVPTVLDIVGLPIPDELPGRSLWTALQGGLLDERTEIVGYSDRSRGGDASTLYTTMEDGFYVRTQRWHFMWFPERQHMELYDVTVDPRSTNNVVDDFPDLVPGFMALIADWRREMDLESPVRMD